MVLHERDSCGIHIELVKAEFGFYIRVQDSTTDENFQLDISYDAPDAGKIALDMFYHPFAYLATKEVRERKSWEVVNAA